MEEAGGGMYEKVNMGSRSSRRSCGEHRGTTGPSAKLSRRTRMTWTTSRRTSSHFGGAYVFDISQTEGKPLPEFTQVSGDPGGYTKRLKAFITKRGIQLDYSERIAPAQGVSSGGRITLLPSLLPAEELSVLTHELAHEMTHKTEERGQLSKAVLETEAEAVAYAVCQSVGLEAIGAVRDYIQLWNGDKKTLTASLERIRAVAGEIIGVITTNKRTEPNRARVHCGVQHCTIPPCHPTRMSLV